MSLSYSKMSRHSGSKQQPDSRRPTPPSVAPSPAGRGRGRGRGHGESSSIPTPSPVNAPSTPPPASTIDVPCGTAPLRAVSPSLAAESESFTSAVEMQPSPLSSRKAVRFSERPGKKAEWCDKNIEIMLKVCIEEVNAENKPHNHFTKLGWTNIARKLIGKDISLGWDGEKKTIAGSDEWCGEGEGALRWSAAANKVFECREDVLRWARSVAHENGFVSDTNTGVTNIGVGKKNLSEETLRLGNVGVPSSFVASQWLEEKTG
ncbi:hypothetical protein HKD37_07G020221 [Glycine soja]